MKKKTHFMMIQTRSNLKPHTTQQKPHNGIVKSRTGLWTLDSTLYIFCIEK